MAEKQINHSRDGPKQEELIAALQAKIAREIAAREQAEALLEERASKLFEINQKLLKQAEDTHKKSVGLEYLHNVSKLIVDSAGKIGLFRSFLTLSREMCGWDVAHYWIPHETEQNTLRSDGYWTWNNDVDPAKLQPLRDITTQINLKFGVGLPGRAAQSGRAEWVIDIESESNLPRKEQLLSASLRSAFALPLRINGQIVAVFELFSRKIRDRDRELLESVETGCAQMGNLLEREQSRQAIIKNFEELKRTQMQLTQSEKMASLGTIAAGVAHEINNPISFILSNTEVTSKYLKALFEYIQFCESCAESGRRSEIESVKSRLDVAFITEDSATMISETIEGAKRVREIVQGLKSFSRVDEAEMKEADVNECIDSTLKILSNELKYKCRIEKDLRTLPRIVCYPGQLIQVFTNLILNASQVVDSKNGVIAIASENIGDSLRIIVRDNGSGIKPEHMNQIFTPFFTTKPVGKGTGLGLSISYGIVKKHGGDILVESRIGEGTTFTIVIPLNTTERSAA